MLAPPWLTALLGQAVHTRDAPLSPLVVLFAPHVQVRAPAPETAFAGQAAHAPPETTE